MKYLCNFFILFAILIACNFSFAADNERGDSDYIVTTEYDPENRLSEMLFGARQNSSWIYDCWDWTILPRNAIMIITASDGNVYNVPLDYINSAGICLRPYAYIFLVAFTANSAKSRVLANFQMRRANAYWKSFSDLSKWGLKGNSAWVIDFETDVTLLPGARMPLMFLNPFNSGVRAVSLPPTTNYLEIWTVSTNRDSEKRQFAKMAKVRLLYTSEGVLFREIVNLSDGEGHYFAGHVFDFVYNNNESNVAYSNVPSKVLLKLWPYDQMRDQITGIPLRKGPGEYGISFQYSIENPAPAFTSFFVKEVIVRDDPEIKYFDEMTLGSMDPSFRPVKITIDLKESKPLEMNSQTLKAFRILQSLY